MKVKMTGRDVLPYLALAYGIIGLGFSAIFVRWANAPGAVTGFYRVLIALGVLAIPFGLEVKRNRPRSRRHLGLALLAGLFFAFDLAAWNSAVLITSAANSTLLANTAPIWVGIGTLVLFKERLTSAFWGGLTLAMLGALLILGFDWLVHPVFGLGDILSLLSGLFYGAFFLATQRAREKLSPLSSWWLAALTSTIVLWLLTLSFRQSLWGYSAATYWNFVALALITQVGGYLAINYALGHLPATIVSSTLLGQPLVTAVLAIPLLDQPIGWVQIIGGLAVLSGVAWVHRSHVESPQPVKNFVIAQPQKQSHKNVL